MSVFRSLASAFGHTRLSRTLGYLAKNWTTFLWFGGTAAAVAAGVSLVLPERFVSYASLTVDAPNRTDLTGGLAQVASEFGITGLENQGTPEFYSDLMHSRTVLTTLATAKFGIAETPLYSLYLDRDTLTPRALERLVKRLQNDIELSVDARTGVIHVSAEAPSPQLAADMLDSLIAIANRFAIGNLRGRAHARRLFVEQQAEDARLRLDAAEDSLRGFYDRNRRTQDSPRLQFEEGRLRRRVDLRQDLFLTLSRELEQARIDEIRDTPVMAVLDAPVAPSAHHSPKRTQITVLGFLFGIAIAGLGLHFSSSLSTGSADRPTANSP